MLHPSLARRPGSDAFLCRMMCPHRTRRFAEWLPIAGTWDFALAPLHESHFNASKSPIKVYEYASLELPAVASDVCPYREVIKDGREWFACQKYSRGLV